MLDNEEERDSFYDEIKEEFRTLPEDAQDDLFRWICEETNEVMEREDTDERTIVGELAEEQRRSLRELGWEI
jgi:succinate dehydrogenase flavin-adding protein (antitoxin of CptAB toxin-antitoxin module)